MHSSSTKSSSWLEQQQYPPQSPHDLLQYHHDAEQACQLQHKQPVDFVVTCDDQK